MDRDSKEVFALMEKYDIAIENTANMIIATSRRKVWARCKRYFMSRKRSPLRMPLIKKLRALRLGFSAQSYALYNLDENNPDDYLRDFTDLFSSLNDPNMSVMNHKFSFSEVLAGLDAPHPQVFGYLGGGRIFEAGRDAPKPIDIATWLSSDVLPDSGLAFKPVRGLGGKGVFFLKRSESGLEINGQEISETDCCSLLSVLRHYYISAFINQAKYARALFPGTTNTVRVLTLWDDDVGEPYVAGTVHRMGSAVSGHVDNFHQGLGGYCSNIDIETGVMSAAVTLRLDGRLHYVDRHPDSDAQISNVQIPGWQDMIRALLRTCRALPQHRFVGWDLVMTDTGFSIIEANAPPGLAVWQVHGGLLVDPRTRSSFQALGMVPQQRATVLLR